MQTIDIVILLLQDRMRETTIFHVMNTSSMEANTKVQQFLSHLLLQNDMPTLL